jgi:hypothetical protein
VFDQTVAKFVELVENAVSARKRVIRVLEVGAGTGKFEFDQSRIWRAFPAPLGPEDVETTVASMSLSPAFADCSEFSGQVTADGSDVSSGSLLGKRHVQLPSHPVDANTCFTTHRVFGIDSSKQGNVIICHRSQVALISSGMHQSATAAIVGRFCSISSVIKKAFSAAAVKKPRVLLHAGHSCPAAIATYTYLKANSHGHSEQYF